MNNLYFIPNNIQITFDPLWINKIEKILFNNTYDPWRGFEKDIKIAFKNSKRVTENVMNSIRRFYTSFRYYDNEPLMFQDIPFNYIVQTLPKLDTKVKKIIINPPATIIIWEDGTKTVVKTHKEDEKAYDPEKGVLFCYLKKIMGKWYYQTLTDLLNNDNLLFQFVKKIIFNDQMTIVIWDDGTKTYAKCNESQYDEEKGLAVCLLKKMMGGSVYIDTIKPQVESAIKEIPVSVDIYQLIGNSIKELGNITGDIYNALSDFISCVSDCIAKINANLNKR